MASRSERIDRDPVVRSVAERARVFVDSGREEALTKYAVERVHKFLDDAHVVPEGLNDVHEVVLHFTGLHVDRVTDGASLAAVSAAYERELPAVGTQLELELDGRTEAFIFRRPSADLASPNRFVAVVDARGERQKSAWFSERHESIHLVLPDPTAQAVVRRTDVERPQALEQVIDSIAAEIGFWAPVVEPVLRRALAESTDVLTGFELARTVLAPDASREASFRAFAKLVDRPLVILYSDYGGRVGDRRAGRQSESWSLRAQVVIANEAARREGLHVPKNHRVPLHSVIQTTVRRRGVTLVEDDDLGEWTSSRGRLPARAVRVTARGGWAAIEPR